MVKNVLFLFIIISALACKKDSSEIVNDLNGTWSMETYTAFISSLPNLNDGDVNWTFDLANNELLIQNNVETLYPYLLQSGNYLINMPSASINIDSVDYDYEIENGTLTISNHPELDGPIMRFKRYSQ